MKEDDKFRLYTQFNTPSGMPEHGLILVDGIPAFELWNLREYLAQHILDRLKALKKANPIGWNTGPHFESIVSAKKRTKEESKKLHEDRREYTDALLDKMIFAFEFYAGNPLKILAGLPSARQRDIYLKKVNQGKKAFIENFGLLWW